MSEETPTWNRLTAPVVPVALLVLLAAVGLVVWGQLELAEVTRSALRTVEAQSRTTAEDIRKRHQSQLRELEAALIGSIDAARNESRGRVPGIDALEVSLAELEGAVGALPDASSMQALQTRLRVLEGALTKLATDEANRAAPISDGLREVSTRLDEVARTTGVVGETSHGLQVALGRLQDVLTTRDDPTGRKARALESLQEADKALSGGRRDDAIVFLMSAATADPANSTAAMRLANVYSTDPKATPEGLAATATTLRALALQCAGRGVIDIWRRASDLDTQSDSLRTTISAADSVR